MPAQLPRDGCIPVCALDRPLRCRRHHLLYTPPAGAGGPAHQCKQSEPRFQHPEQSGPGVKSRQVYSMNKLNLTKVRGQLSTPALLKHTHERRMEVDAPSPAPS